jgi:hypothetical protein
LFFCSGSAPLGFDGSGIGYAYKNTFSNLNVNIQPELDNAAPIVAGGGLEYKCNSFINRKNNDVYLPDGPASTLLTSLIRDQGFCISSSTQAGNVYGSSSGFQQLEFDVNSLTDNVGFQYREQPGVFSYTNLSSSVVPCFAIVGPNSCLSNLSSICAGDVLCLLNNYNSSKAIAGQKQTDFDQLIDGGNTNFLIGQINSSMSSGLLKNLLLSKSPYLSDKVLNEMLQRVNPLPPGHIKQIIIANSPVTKSILDEIINLNLPNGILNNILAEQSGVSARSEKEKEVDYYFFQAQLAEVNLKQGYLELENIDSLKLLSQKDSSLAGLFKQIEILIEQGNFSDAHLCLQKIHSKEEVGIHSDKCKLSAIRLYLSENNLSWFDMTAGQYAIVKQIYENNPDLAIEARTILSLTKGLQYARYPYDANSMRSMSVANEEEGDIISKKASNFSVYPNPCSDFTKVVFNLKEVLSAELIIYNVMGASVYKKNITNDSSLIIDTKNFTNGIYFFVLNTDKGIVDKKKIIFSN